MDTDTLYYGDCLDWCREWDDETVDLIYLDPPFKSDKNYNQLFTPNGGGQAQFRAFTDTWYWDDAAVSRYEQISSAIKRPSHKAISGLYSVLGETGMLAYLTYMAERLEQLARLLKPTGCIVLHCDSAACHFLKVLMDSIFGPKNFLSDIVWKRYAAHSLAKSGVDTITENLLFYAKDAMNFSADTVTEQLSEAKLNKRFRHLEKETGRYFQHCSLEKSSNSSSAGEVRVIQGREVTSELGWVWQQKTFDERLAKNPNLIYWTSAGRPRYKLYKDEYKGRPVGNIWTDIPYLSSGDSERLKYPTQKPLALLRRIIGSFSERDEVVLDPFCGCGTTVEAARELGRKWVGIDISAFAIEVIKQKRLKDTTIPTQGIPFDFKSAEKLSNEAPFDFEAWCITRLRGFSPNTRRTGDRGIDGRATLYKKPDDFDSRLALAQVKGTAKFNLGNLRDFLHVVRRENAALGIYITLNKVSSAKARAESRELGTVSYGGQSAFPRVQLWSIEEYFDHRMPGLPIMADPYTGDPIYQTEAFEQVDAPTRPRSGSSEIDPQLSIDFTN